jgi:hypothetical protein
MTRETTMNGIRSICIGTAAVLAALPIGASAELMIVGND